MRRLPFRWSESPRTSAVTRVSDSRTPAPLVLAAGLLLAAGVTRAEEPAIAAGAADEAADTVAAVLGAAEPLSETMLDGLNGKARIEIDKIQVNDQDLTGTVTDNVAIGNQTGQNTISTGAYTDAAGFITTIQNTGNNVLIQNATIINLTVEP
jgi:hypothetical protein